MNDHRHCTNQSSVPPVAAGQATGNVATRGLLMSVRASALDHLVINVSNVARSAEWYRDILGMEIKLFDPGSGKAPRTSLVFGNQKINVRPRNADKIEWFTAAHEAAGSDDLCFL